MTQRERSAKWYRGRKDNGLCLKCGNKLDREGYYCSECLEKNRIYRRENRDFYRENHICTECGKRIVLGTDKTCPECRAKKNDRRKSLTDEQKKRYKEQRKFLYQERKEQGICTRCGKRRVEKGKAKCSICLKKDAELHRESGITRNERPSYGLCYICGEPLDREGGVCVKCAEMLSKNLPKDRDNQGWENDNKLIFGSGVRNE